MKLMTKSALVIAISLASFSALHASAAGLQEIYELALKNDAQLKADQAAHDAGLANETIARAGLLPQINASYTQSKSDSTTTDNLASFKEPKANANGKNWSISLNQPLFDLSKWYVYKQGQHLSEQAEAQFGADQQSMIVRVATAYFNVLRTVDQLEATIAEENANAHQLEQVKQRFDVGLTAITEVHEAQASYDSAVAATLEARGRLSISFEALEVLTGRAENKIAPLSDTFPVVNPTPADRAEWVKFSLKNNYSLKAAKLRADAAESSADSVRAGHLPTVSANLGYSKSDGDGKTFNTFTNTLIPYDTSTNGKSASVTLNIPIFSGLRTTGQSRQAVAQELQAQEQAQGTERSTIQNARSLHLSVETDVARVTARKQAIISNKSALEATQSGYDVGTRNLVEVLIAQRNLYQARRDYSSALYDYVIDTIKLREVAGMLTPADIKDVDQWLNQASSVTRESYEK